MLYTVTPNGQSDGNDINSSRTIIYLFEQIFKWNYIFIIRIGDPCGTLIHTVWNTNWPSLKISESKDITNYGDLFSTMHNEPYYYYYYDNQNYE